MVEWRSIDVIRAGEKYRKMIYRLYRIEKYQKIIEFSIRYDTVS